MNKDLIDAILVGLLVLGILIAVYDPFNMIKSNTLTIKPDNDQSIEHHDPYEPNEGKGPFIVPRR